ncbi:MAG: hypothetical protein ACXVJT_18185, partial [Thermoanaerobaculia bacterium]
APAPAQSPRSSLAIFPEVSASYDGSGFEFRNEGSATLLTRTYGEPGYRVIVKLLDGNVEIENRWIELPRDLAPGESTRVNIAVPAGASRARLYHALQGIAIVEESPFAELRL